jgi:LysR family hydrogen peroxide-inducible transcriptional activator
MACDALTDHAHPARYPRLRHAIADTHSFSRAAVHCHVSQPSLSQQILKLEDELGVRLFDRLSRTIRLTNSSETFLPRAGAVLRELEAAR